MDNIKPQGSRDRAVTVSNMPDKLSTTLTVITQKCVSSYFSLCQSDFHDSKFAIVVNYLFITIYAIINPKINSNINPNPNLHLTANFTLVLQ